MYEHENTRAAASDHDGGKVYGWGPTEAPAWLPTNQVGQLWHEKGRCDRPMGHRDMHHNLVALPSIFGSTRKIDAGARDPSIPARTHAHGAEPFSIRGMIDPLSANQAHSVMNCDPLGAARAQLSNTVSWFQGGMVHVGAHPSHVCDGYPNPTTSGVFVSEGNQHETGRRQG